MGLGPGDLELGLQVCNCAKRQHPWVPGPHRDDRAIVVPILGTTLQEYRVAIQDFLRLFWAGAFGGGYTAAKNRRPRQIYMPLSKIGACPCASSSKRMPHFREAHDFFGIRQIHNADEPSAINAGLQIPKPSAIPHPETALDFKLSDIPQSTINPEVLDINPKPRQGIAAAPPRKWACSAPRMKLSGISLGFRGLPAKLKP